MTRGEPFEKPQPSREEKIRNGDWQQAWDTLIHYLIERGAISSVSAVPAEIHHDGKSIASQLQKNFGVGAEGQEYVLKLIDLVLIKLGNEVLGTEIKTEAQRSAAHKAVWLGALRVGITGSPTDLKFKRQE